MGDTPEREVDGGRAGDADVSVGTDDTRAGDADGSVGTDGGTSPARGDVAAESALAAGDEEVPRRAGYLTLWKAVLYREYLLFVRYPANAAGGIVISLFFFGLLFYGGRMIAGRALTDSLEGIIVGYFLWTLSVGAYSSISNDIGSEVQWGTLERHFMTPFGFAPVAFAKGVAKVVRTFLTSAVILAVMLVLSGTTLQLPVATIVVVSALAIASVLGLGFAAGGLSVLYKQIGNWLNLLQFGFIVLISAPAFELGWTKFLPLAQGSSMLQRAMIDGVRVWQFPVADLAVLVGVAAAYVGVGYLIFQLATTRARRLGVLGDY